jgi:hypothetical protein
MASQTTEKQKAFYHKQRLDDDAKAEKGDLKAGSESAKIYKKLGSSGKAAKGKHLAAMERGTGEDPEKINKFALAAIPAAAGGIGAAAGALGRAGVGVAGRAALTGAVPGLRKALTGGRVRAAKDVEEAGGSARKALGAGSKAGSSLARKAASGGKSGAIREARQDLGRARPVKQALEKKTSLPSNRKVSAKVERTSGRKALPKSKASSKQKALKKAA